MADSGSELQEELEILEAIYITELQVVRNQREEVSSIILQLHPATGDDDDKKFVCMTLQLDPPAGYPDELPEISIRNPRGIGDEEIQSLLEAMHMLADERRGGPMLYELIELAKESLTVGNLPRCLCMICLENFYEGELFTRTDCYHYFHKSCLARYVQHFLNNHREPETKKLTLHMNQEQRKVQCPVCREEISYEADTLTYSPVEEKMIFSPTQEMRLMQTKMAAMLEKQRAAGGLIDVDAEKNRFLLKDNDVVQLPPKQVEQVEPAAENKRSGAYRRNDRNSAGRRNREENYRNDRYDSHRRGNNRIDRKDNKHSTGYDKENDRYDSHRRDDNRIDRKDNYHSTDYGKENDRHDSHRRGNNRIDRKDNEHSTDYSKGDSRRTGSGFVRGKGRGRHIEDRRDKDVNEKKSVGDRNHVIDDNQIGESKKDFRTDRETMGMEDNVKIMAVEKLRCENEENSKVNKEKKDEVSKPRYDEKINDRHKGGNHRYKDEWFQKDSNRSPRNSSRNEKENDINKKIDSHQTESFKSSNSRLTEEKNNCQKPRKENGDNTSDVCSGLKQVSPEDKSKKSDDGLEKLDKSLNENDNNRTITSGGFRKTDTERIDDNSRSNARFRNHGDRRFGDNDERQRPSGGFGRPKDNYREKRERGQHDRPHSGYESQRNRRRDEYEHKRPSGGFGKPHTDWRDDNRSNRPRSGGDPQTDRNSNESETKRNLDSNWRDHDRKERPHSGFGKPSDRAGERKQNWRDKNEQKRSGFGRLGDRIVDEDQRKKPSGGFGKPGSQPKVSNKSEMHELNVEKTNDHRTVYWESRNEKSRKVNEDYHGGGEDKVSKNDKLVCDDVKATNTINKMENSFGNKNQRDKSFKQDCDNIPKLESGKTMHPPGFRIGPPPGFEGRSKESESVMEPPPGF